MDIEKLKAAAQAATPGPWKWWTSNSFLRLTGADGKDGGVICSYAHAHWSNILCSEQNKAFIAAFNPATALELIAEIERLRAAVGGGAKAMEWQPIDLQRPLRPKDMTEAKRMIVQLQGRLEELKAQQTGEAVIDSDPFPPQETTPVTIEEAVRRANATLTSFEVVTEKPKTTFPPDWEE